MTQEQFNEVDKIIPLLEQCRVHLDNAMYRMGEIDNEHYHKVNDIYSKICRILDLF